jgi:hypothetical protein
MSIEFEIFFFHSNSTLIFETQQINFIHKYIYENDRSFHLEQNHILANAYNAYINKFYIIIIII